MMVFSNIERCPLVENKIVDFLKNPDVLDIFTNVQMASWAFTEAQGLYAIGPTALRRHYVAYVKGLP